MSALAEPHLHPGTRFGDYEVVSELGGGGMGKVYRARDLTLQRIVAVKVLSPQLGADPNFVERFRSEARSAARLNHPNIVQIYGFGNVAGTYYIAMEFVDGYSLGTYLHREPFSEEDSVVIVRHAARALAAAHAEGLVHRDIKPDNIMLTPKGVVKIVDLGIAKQIGDTKMLTQTGYAIGTPPYVSPEQVRGERDIDARADIYSLGATLFHLVTGRAPYDGESGAAVMLKHIVEPVPDPKAVVPSLSNGVCHVIMKMMAKRREDRYPDCVALDRDLYRVQLGQGVETTGARRISIEASGSQEQTIPRVEPAAAPHAPLGGRPPAAASSSVAGTPPGATTPPRATAAGFEITDQELHLIESELARQVGPLARVLIKRAIKGSRSISEALTKLEEEIPAEKGRQAFRGAVKKLRREW